MEVLSKLDDMGKLGWISVTVLGFVLWWPLGITILLFLILTGRFRALGCASGGRWYNMDQQQRGGQSMGGGWCSGRGAFRARPSGNKAFDDYREETLRRLEEDQKEFQEYLERLRQARDKAEFDQFMAERRNRTGDGEPGNPV
jgi:hypothetical protein